VNRLGAKLWWSLYLDRLVISYRSVRGRSCDIALTVAEAASCVPACINESWSAHESLRENSPGYALI